MTAPGEIDGESLELRRRELTTPRSAAVAGILFAVLLGASIVLLRLSVPGRPEDAGTWLTDAGRRRTLQWGLNLVPFAGIAFLWFIGVVRDRIGAFEDRFFSTVFLGSGLLFLALLFAATATAGGLIASVETVPPAIEVWSFGRGTAYTALTVYAVKMAAVFMISTATISWRTGVLPRWLAVLGAVLALGLLSGIGSGELSLLLFPAWVLLVSLNLLVATRHRTVSDT